MSNLYQIRADFDRDTITIYQAYSADISKNALQNQTFSPPFSFRRMTWIKPSFLWLMERTNWGLKRGQDILAIKIKRTAWEYALRQAVLTSPEVRVYKSGFEWQQLFDQALVHLQWDPERSIRGKKLPYFSIQVGISRHLIQNYVDDWIVEIKDYTPLVKKIHKLCVKGEWAKAKRLLPTEKLYPISEELKGIIGGS